ncbi:MAG: aldehyde dehydrogenase family protein, partial [Nitrosopumilus sp.]
MSTLQEVKTDYGKLKIFVEGNWVESESSNYQQVMNPALDQVIAEVPICKSSEVDQAIKVANEAFESW